LLERHLLRAKAAFRVDRLTAYYSTQLEQAGFRDVRVLPDLQGIFPTFVAKKPR